MDNYFIRDTDGTSREPYRDLSPLGIDWRIRKLEMSLERKGYEDFAHFESLLLKSGRTRWSDKIFALVTGAMSAVGLLLAGLLIGLSLVAK